MTLTPCDSHTAACRRDAAYPLLSRSCDGLPQYTLTSSTVRSSGGCGFAQISSASALGKICPYGLGESR